MKDELPEVRRVAKRLEDWPIELSSEIDLSMGAITEPQPQNKVSKVVS
jgi:hypothetical protein